jgi:hypothetical protein
MRDWLRIWLNVLFALLLFPASRFSVLSGIGRPIQEGAVPRMISPEVPAGYAFAIWGPIFALTAIYAVRQALPGMRDAPLYRAIGWATIVSSAANVTWMMLAQTVGNGWWLVLTIVTILIAAVSAFFGVLRRAGSLDRFDRWIVLPMTGILAGWLSAAVWLNVASYIKQLQPDRFGLSATVFAIAVLAAVTVFGWTILRRARGNAWYAGTLIWALAGVVVANSATVGGDRTVALAAAGVALLTLSIALLLPDRARRAAAGTA